MLNISQELFLNRNCTLISNEYINPYSQMKFRCNKHPNSIQYASYTQAKYKIDICVFCKNEKEALIRFKNASEECHKYGFILLDKYEDFLVKNFNEKLKVKCINHLNIIQDKRFSDLKRGNAGCIYCYHEEKSKILKGRQLFGEDNPNWKGGITSENHKIRTSIEYINWRNEILKRDNFTCQCCGDNRGGNLQAHHIENFADNRELIFDINNGITLCNNCHNPSIIGSFHNVYGTKNNNMEQLHNYIDNYKNGHVKNRKNIHIFVGKLDDSLTLLESYNGKISNLVDIFKKFNNRKVKLEITKL